MCHRHVDMSPDPPFVKGFNNPKYREQVLKATRDAIDACADFGCKNVICFTGMREGIPDDVGADNCVEGFKQIVGHAEKKGVTLCLEMLNSRVSTHPMKGHPGYQGDHTDYCIDIIKRVGSPNLKLLFDIYHVQIMDGDIISRIRQHRDFIGHVHTAGNPGRGELDDKQEINYPPIMEALLEIGYQGPRRPGVHPDPRPARRPAAGRGALRRVTVPRHSLLFKNRSAIRAAWRRRPPRQAAGESIMGTNPSSLRVRSSRLASTVGDPGGRVTCRLFCDLLTHDGLYHQTEVGERAETIRSHFNRAGARGSRGHFA